MALLAWGVEQQVESQLGRPLDRAETYQAQQRSTPPPGAPDLAHRLETQVLPYWIPLRPVQVTTPTNPSSLRLQRAALLGSGGNPAPVPPLGRILEPDMALVLFDYEIPREGLQVTRGYRYARWTDGSPHFWADRTRGRGRGQGSSGLRFVLLERS